jgi:hypothetical protein
MKMAGHRLLIASFHIGEITKLFILWSSSSSIGTTTLVGFRPAQMSLSILSRKVLQSAVASGTSNPQLGGDFVLWCVAKFCRCLQGRIGLAADGSERVDYTVV